MRKVKFTIDDIEYMKQFYNLDENQSKELFGNSESFKAIYTLFGDEKSVNRYELTDHDGNPIELNSINGYQKGVILSDCYSYYTGGKYFDNQDHPHGVIKIEESEI